MVILANTSGPYCAPVPVGPPYNFPRSARKPGRARKIPVYCLLSTVYRLPSTVYHLPPVPSLTFPF